MHNTSQFVVNASAWLLNGAMSDTFILDPLSMTLEPGQIQVDLVSLLVIKLPICLNLIIIAAEGKVISLYFTTVICFLYFVSIEERPAMESQPNLASKSEVVSIYKCPPKIFGTFFPIFGEQKTSNFGPLFPRLPHLTPHIFGMKCRIDKQKS